MISKVVVFSRREVRYLLEAEDVLQTKLKWALISICTKPEEKLINKSGEQALKKQGCSNVLTEFFGDYSNIEYIQRAAVESGERIYIFNEDNARRIISFIDNIHSRREELALVVHCDAGVARSGSVGIFATRYLGLNEKAFRDKNPNIFPNPFVYDSLYKISGMKGEYEKFWQTELERLDSKEIF